MPRYYVHSVGDHEVHEEGCSYLPLPANREYLGTFASCHGAVAEAKRTYRSANGCYWCSRACHTG